MTLIETAAPPGLASAVRVRMSDALPLIGLGFAVIVNAIWIAFLTYCLLKLIWTV